MNPETENLLKDLAEAKKNLNIQIGIIACSTLISIPLSLIGIAIDNNALAVGSICWLVSHFIGYTSCKIVYERNAIQHSLDAIKRTEQSRETASRPKPWANIGMN